MPPAVVAPPPTPEDSVTEILHGVEITDPYRWLEDQNSPRTRAWLEEQTRYTRAYLDAMPGRGRIRKRVEELLAVEVISEPWKVGNRYFFLKRGACQEQPAIMMRNGHSGEDIVLVDPASRSQKGEVAVNIVSISADGKFLAYSVRHGGTDSQAVEFIYIPSRELLHDRLPDGYGTGLAFAPDGTGFYYSHEILSAPVRFHRAVYWHRFGTGLQEDKETFFAGESPHLHVGALGSSNGRFLAYVVTRSSDPITSDLYLHDLTDAGPPQKVVEGLDAFFAPFFVKDKLFALTNWKAPNLRIVTLESQAGIRTWRDVVSESRLRIQDFATTDNFIAVGYIDGFSPRLDLFDLDGHQHCRIPCQPNGTAHLLLRTTESDTLFYSFSSFDQPPTIFSYCPLSGKENVWAKNQLIFDHSSFEVEQVRFTSKDGTEIPMLLVRNRNKRLSGSLPTFLTAYGGFGTCLTPKFNVYSSFLIERGFLLAFANVRGGGEFGEVWHCAGKRHNRQNSVDDFIAAAEWLLLERHAVPGRIAIGGGSNAGLLVGAAITQRPDLFSAAVCLGPLLDMIRYHKFDSAESWVDEYGCSDNIDDFSHLLGYSPYQSVKPGVPYPAVLFISGDADTRCNPMHARKMTAKLQAATSSGNPILLDYKHTWGHAPVQPLSRRIEALTDRLAFICHELRFSYETDG